MLLLNEKITKNQDKLQHEKINIQISNGQFVDCVAPVIISASRATDIPAFYTPWFFNRLKSGYVKWYNPFNGKARYVSFLKTRLIVFWSKNPAPLLPYFEYLDKKNINYYLLFTLNDYDDEKLEPEVPPLKQRVETFIRISGKTGKEKVIWRFDPFILTNKITTDRLLEKVEKTGNQIYQHTEKLIFSFARLGEYKKVMANLNRENIAFKEFSDAEIKKTALGLSQLNAKWNLTLGSCAEKTELSHFGIIHNKCIDDELIARLFPNDEKLMKFIGYNQTEQSLFKEKIFTPDSRLKDKGQRKECNCILSKDIGQYNTCPHLCVYCYANSSKKSVLSNNNRHSENRESIVVPRTNK